MVHLLRLMGCLTVASDSLEKKLGNKDRATRPTRSDDVARRPIYFDSVIRSAITAGFFWRIRQLNLKLFATSLFIL